MADEYTPQWRERAEADNNTFIVSPEALRQFDLRTAPDRLQAYCDALDRRVEALEAAVANQELRMSLPLHAGRMAEQDRRIEQLERALLGAGHRIGVLEHRLALLEDAEVRETERSEQIGGGQ